MGKRLDEHHFAGDNVGKSTQTPPPPAFARRFRASASEWQSATRFLASPSAAAERVAGIWGTAVLQGLPVNPPAPDLELVRQVIRG